jgi:E3 ubiquitin-protein ligase RNF115/126
MENQKKYYCYSCNKECQIIKAMEDGEEVYQCSTCKNPFVEELEEKNQVQNIPNTNPNIHITTNINTNSNSNTINSNINNINISIVSNISEDNQRQNTQNNSSSNTNNSNANIQDEYGLNNTLLFLPSTVHYERLNQNNMFSSVLNSVGGIFSNIAGPAINNIFSSLNLNNPNNTLLSFLNNHNNDFQFNNLVNIIMSFESSLHGNPPASQRAMDSLPKIEITNENVGQFKDITCNICLECFSVGNIVRVLECKHEFHENCIITWLKTRNTCPVCRHELESNDPNYERRKNNHRENLRNYHRSNTNNNNNNNNNNNDGGSGTFV